MSFHRAVVSAHPLTARSTSPSRSDVRSPRWASSMSVASRQLIARLKMHPPPPWPNSVSRSAVCWPRPGGRGRSCTGSSARRRPRAQTRCGCARPKLSTPPSIRRTPRGPTRHKGALIRTHQPRRVPRVTRAGRAGIPRPGDRCGRSRHGHARACLESAYLRRRGLTSRVGRVWRRIGGRAMRAFSRARRAAATHVVP